MTTCACCEMADVTRIALCDECYSDYLFDCHQRKLEVPPTEFEWAFELQYGTVECVVCEDPIATEEDMRAYQRHQMCASCEAEGENLDDYGV